MCCAIRARKAIFGARWNGTMGVCAGIEVDDELDELAEIRRASRTSILCLF